MTFLKKCKNCGDFFESGFMNINSFCSKSYCQSIWQNRLNDIKKQRNFNMDYLDIYNSEYPIGDKKNYIDYEKVCRFCGERLLNKKGEYSYKKRHCKKHTQSWLLFHWNSIRYNYFLDLNEKQEKEIIEILKKMNITFDHNNLLNYLVLCEECNCLTKYYDVIPLYYDRDNKEEYFRNFNILKTIPKSELHHIIAVHTLNEKNILLIFEIDNLIILCKSCHDSKRRKPKLHVKIRNREKYKKIDEYWEKPI